MSICDEGGPPDSSTAWWKDISVSDAASCTATVLDFITKAEAPNANQLHRALPLYILCVGDCTELAERIKSKTNQVREEIKAALNAKQNDNAHHISSDWGNRLITIFEALSYFPGCYENDASEIRKNICLVLDDPSIILREPRPVPELIILPKKPS